MARNKAESKAIADNAIRWCTNILVEVNANHVGPNFSATREELMEIISRLNAVQRTLYKEETE